MKFRASDSATKPSINITPLLDAVFILLLFFAVSTSFMYVGAIEVELPKADTTTESKSKDTVRVVVTKDNQFRIDNATVTSQDLNRALADIHAASPGSSLIIEADTGSLHGAVVRVIDAGKAAGFESFAIATEEPLR